MALVKKMSLTTMDNEQFLNKRVPIKTILSILSESLSVNEQKLISKLKEHLSTGHKKETKLVLAIRKKPLIELNERFPQLAYDFKLYYQQRNYAESTLNIHMRNLRQFVSFIETSEKQLFETLSDMSQLTKSIVLAYEELLISRLNNEEIQGNTVYRYLSTVKLFLEILREKSIVAFSYVIPEALREQGIRSNDYIETEEIKRLIETIVLSKCRMSDRDMCIVLLIMEIGCRPIEVTNLELEDLIITERKLKVHSIKSGTRTLTISKDLIDLLKHYLTIRKTLQVKTSKLFINCFGDSLTTNGIRAIFERYNKIAFGENRFNPKALRHTYATNALDNLNDFDEVSASMGHLHRCSTEWYIHRSVQRMLKKTLPHNPLNQIKIGE